jgi:DNA-binding MarR family transcriptional regulator
MRALLSHSNAGVFGAIDELGLSFTQTKIVMTWLGNTAPRSIKQIGDDLGLSLPAASRAVDGLLKRGLVTRTEAERERRVKEIALTEDGQAIADRLIELRVAGIREFVASLDPADRKQLAQTLEPIVERISPHA